MKSLTWYFQSSLNVKMFKDIQPNVKRRWQRIEMFFRICFLNYLHYNQNPDMRSLNLKHNQIFFFHKKKVTFFSQMELQIIESIRNLLSLLNNNNDSNKQEEEEEEDILKKKIQICEFLWDCSSIQSNAKILIDNFILDVYLDILKEQPNAKNNRIFELCLGLLANLSSLSFSMEIYEKQRIGNQQNILQLLIFSDDERILLELIRLFWTSLFDEKSKEKWIEICTEPIEIFKQFLFILENTLSPELFKSTANLLQSIQSILEKKQIGLSSLNATKANELCLESIIRLLLSLTNVNLNNNNSENNNNNSEKFIRNEETIYNLLLLLDSILRSSSSPPINLKTSLKVLIDCLCNYLIQFDVPDTIALIDLAILFEIGQQQQQQSESSSIFIENKPIDFILSLLNSILSKSGIDFVEMHDEELFSAHWTIISKLLKLIVLRKDSNANQKTLEIVLKNFEIFTDAHQNESLVSLYPLPIEALKLLGIEKSKLNELKSN